MKKEKSYKRAFWAVFLVAMLAIGIAVNLSGKGQKEDNVSVADGKEADADRKETEADREEISTGGEEARADEEELTERKVEEILRNMTLEQKIYQLFIVTPEQLTGVSPVTSAAETDRDRLAQYPVGGLIYFSSNLVSEEQTTEMLRTMQQYALETEGIPLFLCVDEEGGRVARIANNSGFDIENVGPMAGTSSREEAYQKGEIIGGYLHRMGFNVDFAPDADVLTNSKNTAVGDRSFGTEALAVAEYAAAYSDGLHAHDILSTFKHFPGHGAAEADTHDGYACTSKDYDALMENELVPFSMAQENQVDMVMAAHISAPNVTGDDTPCSLSEKMLTDILRNDLGYGGLIVTDALNMGAICQRYDSSAAAVKAVQAGADLLLMPKDFPSAYDGIYDAVMTGTITEERIDESMGRILRAKVILREKMIRGAQMIQEDKENEA